ncbi:MAG: 50S ribosomal protein L17 [Pseudomonadota bacterium]
MRHHVDGKKLGRTSAHRKAMFANMATSLILNDRIETTLPKARELRRVADRLVTLGKRKTLHAQRRAVAIIHNKKAVHKLFAELAKRFADRNGGYTRILKLGWRHGDSAPMAAIEYIDGERKHAHAEGGEHSEAKKKARVEKKRAQKAGKKAAAHTAESNKATAKHSAKGGKPAVRKTASARKAPQSGD